MSALLKPCAHCGGTEIIITSDAQRLATCGNCGAEARLHMWNRRSDPSREAMREALEAIVVAKQMGFPAADILADGSEIMLAARAALALDGDAK